MTKFLYHTGNPNYRRDIASKGLVPRIGDSYGEHYDDPDDIGPAVFLTELDKQGMPYNSTYDDDIYAVALRDLDKKALIVDKEIFWTKAYMYTEIIPPEDLYLIYKGHAGEDADDDTLAEVKQSIKDFEAHF